MNFDLSDDQKLFVKTAADFAKRSSPVSRHRRLRDEPRGFEPAVWNEMGELGFFGIPFSEASGGFGGRLIDAALVVEKLATTLTPEPYIPSVLAGRAIERAGTAAQIERYLAPMIAGETVLAVAALEARSRFAPAWVETRAEPTAGGIALTGEKTWVMAGHGAGAWVVSAREHGRAGDGDGISLFIVDSDTPGVTVTPIKTMDGRGAAMIAFAGTKVDDSARLGEPGAGLPILEDLATTGCALACAEGLGVIDTALWMTVDYLKTREQFGVKIGTFQALAHRAVDMFVEVELCRSMSILASLAIDELSGDERKAAVSAAMAQLAMGGRLVVRQAIQLFGGIGITDEADIGLYFKRLECLTRIFGDEDTHVCRYASLPGFAATGAEKSARSAHREPTPA